MPAGQLRPTARGAVVVAAALIVALAVPATAQMRGVPTVQQIQWQNRIGVIIHYDPSTYVGTQGCNAQNWANSSNPKVFDPPGGVVDVDSWIEAIKAAGATYALFVAKHNCGFISWPSNVTLPGGAPYTYGVTHSNWPQLDVVATFVKAAKAAGVNYGFYYSLATNTYLNVQGNVVQPANTLQPGMANVTQDEFYAIALGHLRELWGTYAADQGSPVFEMWFDGGLPQDPVFGPQIVALRNELSGDAMAFNGYPTTSDNVVRWIGEWKGRRGQAEPCPLLGLLPLPLRERCGLGG
jgi:alpha-L-fucosidase